jgi:hypothetical protein
MKTIETLRSHAAARLEHRVGRRLRSRFRGRLPEALIHRALAEAREAAEYSGWAVLVLPVLAEEIVSRLTVFADSPALVCAA